MITRKFYRAVSIYIDRPRKLSLFLDKVSFSVKIENYRVLSKSVRSRQMTCQSLFQTSKEKNYYARLHMSTCMQYSSVNNKQNKQQQIAK